MPTCAVPYCALNGVHRFPKNNPAIRQKWERAIRRKGFTASKMSRICRNHFKTSDYYIFEASNGRQIVKLKKDAVPSVFSWTKKSRNKQNPGDKELESYEPDINDEDTHCWNSSLLEENVNDQECYAFETEVEISSSIFPIDVLKNNTMMFYYTGLGSYIKFAHILSTLSPQCYALEYEDPEIKKLTVTDCLLLTLMKLRRNTPNTELTFLFALSNKNINDIFVTWINFIYEIWSDRYFVKFSVPEPFSTEHKEILIKKSYSPFLPEVIEENLNNVDAILDMFLKGKSELQQKGNFFDKSYVFTSLLKTFKILVTDLNSYHKPLPSQIIFACLMIHNNFRDNIVRVAINNVS